MNKILEEVLEIIVDSNIAFNKGDYQIAQKNTNDAYNLLFERYKKYYLAGRLNEKEKDFLQTRLAQIEFLGKMCEENIFIQTQSNTPEINSESPKASEDETSSGEMEK